MKQVFMRAVRSAAAALALLLCLGLCSCGQILDGPGMDRGTDSKEGDPGHAQPLTAEKQISLFVRELHGMLEETEHFWSSACVTDMDGDGNLELAIRYRTGQEVSDAAVLTFYQVDAEGTGIVPMEVDWVSRDGSDYYGEQYTAMVYEDPNGVRHYVFNRWQSAETEDGYASAGYYDDMLVVGDQIRFANISSERYRESGGERSVEYFSANGVQIGFANYVRVQNAYFDELLGDYTLCIAEFSEVTSDALTGQSEAGVEKALVGSYAGFRVSPVAHPLTLDNLQGAWKLSGGEVEGDSWTAEETGREGMILFDGDTAKVFLPGDEAADLMLDTVIADEVPWGGGMRMAYLFGAEDVYKDLTVLLREENVLEFSFTVSAGDGTQWAVIYLFERV